MEIKTERINRLGHSAWYGHSMYIKEIEKIKTNEKSTVSSDDVVEMPSHLGNKINYLV